MTPTEVFAIANTTVLPMWLLMIFVPTWKPVVFLINYKVVPIALSVVYAIYIALSISGGTIMDFGSLSSVMTLFTQEEAALAGWIHYLAFDLLLGMWMVDQNNAFGLHRAIMAPCLMLTFLLGPIGFLLFTIVKTLKNQLR